MKMLLVYHSRCIANGRSPAQLLTGRLMCSNVPICDNLRKGQDNDALRETKEIQKQKQKWYFEREAQEHLVLKSGDGVSLRNYTSNTWDQQGTIKCLANPVTPGLNRHGDMLTQLLASASTPRELLKEGVDMDCSQPTISTLALATEKEPDHQQASSSSVNLRRK